MAREKLKHHRLLEVLMAEALGMSPDEAHNESVKIMLLASCEFVNYIDQRYEHPRVCPCGEDIPETDRCEF